MKRRWPSKEVREIVAAVTAAGGTVQLTSKGHLRITGPGGVAIIGSSPNAGRQGKRGLANTLATIRRETGLSIDTPRGAKPRRTTHQPQHARTVTT